MPTNKIQFTPQQQIFYEIFVGTLVYAVVLALFSDYTSIVQARSFSIILYASFVLELLTYSAFWLKGQVIDRLKKRSTRASKVAMFFAVWFIMFVSKFVFIGVLDLLFGHYILVRGFFGILAVVASVTIIYRLAEWYLAKLGGSS